MNIRFCCTFLEVLVSFSAERKKNKWEVKKVKKKIQSVDYAKSTGIKCHKDKVDSETK